MFDGSRNGGRLSSVGIGIESFASISRGGYYSDAAEDDDDLVGPVTVGVASGRVHDVDSERCEPSGVRLAAYMGADLTAWPRH